MEKKPTKTEIGYNDSEFDAHDLGLTSGYFADGKPYVAEMWDNEDGQVQVSFLMPCLFSDEKTDHKSKSDGNIVGFQNEILMKGGSGVCVGMVLHGSEEDFDVVKNYVSYLESAGVIEFTSRLCNGTVNYLTDINGNDLAEVIITLEESGRTFARTDLLFDEIVVEEDKRARFRVLK